LGGVYGMAFGFSGVSLMNRPRVDDVDAM